MLRATMGLFVVGLMFYLSPSRQPFSSRDTDPGLAEAAQLGLRGVLADGGADGALAAAGIGRVIFESARTPSRIISLSDPRLATPPRR